MKSRPLSFIWFISGIFILALGVNYMISVSGFGLSPWDAFYNGLFHDFGMTQGFWIFIANGLFLLFIMKVDKRYISLFTLISFVLMSVFVDFAYFNATIQHIIHDTNPYLSFLLGALLIGFGLGMYIASDVGFAPHDAFILSLSKKWNVSFRKASIAADVGILILALLLKGPVHMGTLVMALTTGFTIQFSIKFNKRLLKTLSKVKLDALKMKTQMLSKSFRR